MMKLPMSMDFSFTPSNCARAVDGKLVKTAQFQRFKTADVCHERQPSTTRMW
jgi:hypothetical protein